MDTNIAAPAPAYQETNAAFPRLKRICAKLLLVLFDLVSIAGSTFFTLLVSYQNYPVTVIFSLTLKYAPWLCIVYIGLYIAFGLYNSLWRYNGFSEASNIIVSLFIGTCLCLFANAIASYGAPTNVIIMASMLISGFAVASRFGYRFYRHAVYRGSNKKAPLLIVGAGYTGSYIISQIQTGKFSGGTFNSIVLVDDDPKKQGYEIHGVPVAGFLKDIPDIVTKRGITEAIIAIPTLSREEFAKIFEILSSSGCHVRMIPLVEDANDQKIRPLREVNISDILFRSEVNLDKQAIGSYIKGKRVLVTGGGGSIGSELCRQIARFGAKSITILDIYENCAYELYCELKDSYGEALDVRVAIGSIRDKKRLQRVFEQNRPEIVFHAAAHKHVPLMEDAPAEAVKNNVFGTLNVLEVAHEYGVERFVQISTDKAVNPANVMGATKRVAELLTQSFARKTSMKCMTVRFGNVLGSHGSVIPLMERQIKNGGPVKVTHPDITRYFMTIPEASQLVLQAGALAESGTIYVLDMDKPIRIMDLAEKLIRLYGYEPNVSMPIEITGLRKGEKLYEELTMADEKSTLSGTEHGRIFKVHTPNVDLDWLDKQIPLIIRAAQNSDSQTLALLKKIVPSYHAPQAEAFIPEYIEPVVNA